MSEGVLELCGVSVIRSGTAILEAIDWTVRSGERWAVLGPNGSGKTTLLSIAATYLWPSHGTVSVLGSAIGNVDVRELRRSIGISSAAIEARVPPGLTARDVVLAGATAALAPWWDRYDEATVARAEERLRLVGCAPVAGRRFELLSSGERQRVQIARALMSDPALLLLDEPAAGLDMGARETLAALLGRLNADPRLRAIVLVTHHVEEIPAGTTHALILRAGRVLAAGPAPDVLTGDVLTRAFGVPLAVDRSAERYRARAADGPDLGP